MSPSGESPPSCHWCPATKDVIWAFAWDEWLCRPCRQLRTDYELRFRKPGMARRAMENLMHDTRSHEL